ncbi:MAG: response regulator [Campylobacterales bacterium]|nr:response regulator [Campylobacterales bacterium]
MEKFQQYNDQIDIVVSDILMPIMNGIEMSKRILSLKPQTPVVLTTAHTDARTISEAMDLDIDKYIPKPIQFKNLTHTIVELVMKYRKVNDLQILAKELAQKSSKNEELTQDLQTKVDFFEKQSQYYKTIIDNFVISFQTDKIGIIIDCSNKFCNFFEYPKDEIIGQSVNIIRCEMCNSNTFQQNMLQAIHSKKTVNTQHTVVTKSNVKYVVDVTMTPRYNDEGLVDSYMFYVDLVKL